MLPLLRQMRDAVAVPVAAQPAAFRTTDACQCFTRQPAFPDELETIQVSRREFVEFGRIAKSEGIRYVASHAGVRALLAVKAGFGLTLGGVLVLLAFFGEKVFAHGNGAGIAMLWTARGIGSFAGPFAAFRLAGHDERGLRRSIGYAYALLVVCYLAFALSPEIGYAAVALAVANAGGSILWTSGSTLLQRIVPDSVRGRVAAAEMGGFMLALSVSTLAVGLLLDRGVPARALMAACGLAALLPLALWLSTEGRAAQ